MTRKSDKEKLEKEGIYIQGLLDRRLLAGDFQCLVKYLENENFKKTLKIIIDERNDRARTTLRLTREHTSVVAQVYRLQKELLNLEKSEIYQAGKWLFNALSKNGDDRRKSLLEKDLVDKIDHNEIVLGMTDTIQVMDETTKQAQEQSNQTIRNLEKGIDNLKNILMTKKDSEFKLKKFLKLFQERYGSDELLLLIELINENDGNN
jgi:hypothetical protein